ncbi:hypothetical protein AVEN_180586-1 [Araneus ventricosus]|uniref:Uncharacterized protein n=1 Tax=Araneus ventricosus TaxID=182803 RepID=A0A4Y2N8W5_ARAVE|nr:hypothetical protein AVEN_180586-1 [Araneus ventricosus]
MDYRVDAAGPPISVVPVTLVCFDVWGLAPPCKRLTLSRNRPGLFFLMVVCNFWWETDQEDLQEQSPFWDTSSNLTSNSTMKRCSNESCARINFSTFTKNVKK